MMTLIKLTREKENVYDIMNLIENKKEAFTCERVEYK